MNSPDIARIIICDDSPAYVQALTRFLECDEDLLVIAVCSSAEELLRRLPKLRADLVTMDVELPGLDGLRATERIMSTNPLPIVVINARPDGASETVAATLAAGALDAVNKQDIRLEQKNGPAAVALRRRIKRLSRTRLRLKKVPSALPAQSVTELAIEPPSERESGVVAIGASTGGPAALMTVLAGLPGDFPLPVLIVQHISPGFVEGLAGWLDRVVALPVRLAEEGQVATPGVWLAPDDVHLRIADDRRLTLDGITKPTPHRPSADVLLTSVAQSAGSGAVSVVLTGMGRDGAAGTAAVLAAGGLTLAQDRASSVIYGMPRAAAERGAELVLGLNDIAGVLRGLRSAVVAR
jgi:two-component system chemotaxis response regulator CheB